MTTQLSSKELLNVVQKSKARLGEDLVAAIRKTGGGVQATKSVAATELLPVYRTRLLRFRESGLPPSDGLPEFVQAIESAGQRDVLIVGYTAIEDEFVLLLSENARELLAIVKIARKQNEKMGRR